MPTSLDQDGVWLLPEERQELDELALATLGYLVLPIKSPGLKMEPAPPPLPLSSGVLQS